MSCCPTQWMKKNAYSRHRRKWVAAFLLCQSFTAQASIHINVTTTADEFGGGPACSFREALYAVSHAQAYGGCALGSGFLVDSISLPAGTYTINRPPVMGNPAAGGAFYVASSVFISGGGAGQTFLDGGLIDRVVDIEPAANGSSVTVYALSIRNGLTPFNGLHGSYGAGIYANFHGTLSLANTVVSDSGDNSGSASALFVESAAANLTASTIMHNHATGVFLYATATSTLDNVTISGNSPDYIYTGGLLIGNTPNTVTINNSTIAYNTGSRLDNQPNSQVGGLYVSQATVNLRNSIIARNSVGARTNGADCRGAIVSQGYNLIEDTGNCGISGSPVGNLTGVDPKLAPLFDYGAHIPTHLLLPGSPALDAGNPAASGSGGNACLSSDARGVQRTTSRCDMGAYDYHVDFVVDTTQDAVDATPGNNICATALAGNPCSLRAAIMEANRSAVVRTIYVPAGDYKLTIPSSFQQGDDTTGSLDLNKDEAVTLIGDGADRTLIEQTVLQESVIATGQMGPQTPTSLHGITLSGGDASLYSGGLTLLDGVRITNSTINAGVYLPNFDANANLLMVASTVDHNTGQAGGGLYVGTGTSATIVNSTFANNATSASGGAIYNNGGTVSLVFSTIANNTAMAAFAGDVGGGGIARGGTGSFFIGNSIIANNVDASGQAADCAASVQLTGHTLLRDTAGCTLGGQAVLALSGRDPLLTPLLMQGGSTPTFGLLPASPAHGVLTYAPDCIDGNGIEALNDQRSSARYAGFGYGTSAAQTCDLGAYQGSNTDVIFADSFE